MIENLSPMNKVIERPRGLSRRTLVLLGVAVVLLIGLVLLFPTHGGSLRVERRAGGAWWWPATCLPKPITNPDEA